MSESIHSTNSAKDFMRVAVIICVYVMLREFKPVEAFFTAYLTSPPLNLTSEEVNEKIYPIGTYAAFLYMILVLLVTDYVKYKPVIIVDGINGILAYSLLIGNPSRTQLFFEQVFYGFTYGSEIACDTYLYAKVEDTSQFQRLTGYVRASCLIGRCISSLFAQTVVTFGLNKKFVFILPFSTVTVMIFITIWAFAIPSVTHGLYFHRRVKMPVVTSTKLEPMAKDENSKSQATENVPEENLRKLSDIAGHIWSDFKSAYTNLYIIKWSLWWSLSLAGYYYFLTYSQVLWQTVVDENGNTELLMNGGVDAVTALVAASLSYGISQVDFPWRLYGNWFLLLGTVILSALLFLTAVSNLLWIIYPTYAIFGACFQAMLTIAHSEVAQNLEKDSYALVFGFNNLAALGICSVLTYTIIEGHLTTFNTREQFLFYGCYFLSIAMVILLKAITSTFFNKDKKVINSSSIDRRLE